jgi:ComEC/Rec2-related protein
MTGMSPPVLRAVISALLGVLSRKLGVRFENGPSIIAPALIMLLINPRLIFSISFLLTFAAVVGLIYWSPILKEIFYFIPESLEEGSIVTVAALLTTFPISLYYFSTISLLSLPTNFLVGPLVGLIMTAGFLAIFTGVLDFILPVSSIVYWLVWAPLDIFVRIIKFMHSFKFLYLNFEWLNEIQLNVLVFAVIVLEISLIFLFLPFNKAKLPKYL